MVRLKGRVRKTKNPTRQQFQFQYGTIKRGFAKPKTPHDNSFNSNMVRLKAEPQQIPLDR